MLSPTYAICEVAMGGAQEKKQSACYRLAVDPTREWLIVVSTGHRIGCSEHRKVLSAASHVTQGLTERVVPVALHEELQLLLSDTNCAIRRNNADSNVATSIATSRTMHPVVLAGLRAF